MQINKDVLKSLNPCTSRYWNFLKYNADFSGSFSEFLELDSVSYSDKVWVAEKALNKNQAVSWAILCADSVVYVFEAKHPGNKRLSNCIRYLKTVKDFNSLTDIEKSEIKKHEDISGVNYDTSAAHHALYAAHCAVYAAHYVTLATYANYATSAAFHATNAALLAAADTGEDADSAGNNQKALNLQFLRMACSL